MKKKEILNLTRWLITIALLLYVFQKAGLFQAGTRRRFIDLVLSADLVMFGVSIGIAFVGNLSNVLKWWMLLRSKSIDFGFIRAYAYFMVARFFNLVLPTNVGGDLVRIHELGRHTGRLAEAAASVFVERFSGMITLFLLTVVTVLLNVDIFHAPVIIGSMVFLLPMICVLYWLIIDERPIHALQRSMCADSRPFFRTIFEKIWKVHRAVAEYRTQLWALFWAFINSIVFYFIAVMNVWISALAFDPSVEFFKVFTLVPVLLLIMNLPVSIGGFGLMEFAYAFTFELVGYSTQLAFSVALLMRLKSFMDASIGGLIYLFLNKGKSPRSEMKGQSPS